jgi:tryptophan synthase alpha chain
MASQRLLKTFNRLAESGKTGIIPFVTVGYPDVETTLEMVPALAKAGADVIELGVPFSDPLADGATIQKASFQALRQGVTLKRCLEVCRTLREGGLAIPLVFMGYYNQLLAMGLDTFAREGQETGLDGVIVPDIPPEESGPLMEACGPRGIDVISLLAPTSTDERIAAACAIAGGFIYCVSLAGVTGARRQLSEGGRQLVQRVRAHTKLPVAVGFGLSKREHIEEVGTYADAAIIGSALVDIIERAPPGGKAARAATFLQELQGRTQPVERGSA